MRVFLQAPVQEHEEEAVGELVEMPLRVGGPTVADMPSAAAKPSEGVAVEPVAEAAKRPGGRGEAGKVEAAAEAAVVDPAATPARVSELLLRECPLEFFRKCFSLKCR